MVAAQARTYQVRTYGCQMNVHDSERIAGLLESHGYVRTEAGVTADVVVLNTCAVRENADNKLYGNLGHLASVKRGHPGMQIAVGGCLAQKDRESIVERAPWVDVVFGTHNVGTLPALLRRAEVLHEAQVEIEESLSVFPSTLPSRRHSAHSAWVAISVGCNNTCTFCIVPALRGKERDRRPGEILQEVEALAADGVIEITLLGQNVNAYGAEFGDRRAFADLLRACGRVPGVERIRFTSPHPRDFTDDVIEAMAETDSVMPSLHMPLQSGSDRILRAMRRSYRAERFLGILDSVRARIPEAAVTTDIIVGFPGETEDDFAATLDVVRRARFSSAFTFQYSPRPGTPAADLPGQVPKEVVQERYDRLATTVEEIAWAENRRCVGSTVEVLVSEGEGRKDDLTARRSGRARDARLVHYSGQPDARPGDLVDVLIDSAAPHHLLGTALRTRPHASRRGLGGQTGAAVRDPRFAGRPDLDTRARSSGHPDRARAALIRPVAQAWPTVVAVVGPTASGKSEVALELAQRLGAEIVNADAFQLYRGMDIGTAKPSAADRARVRHHLLDRLDVTEDANVAEYQSWARAALRELASRAVPAIVVGGSGLYLRALLDDLQFPGSDPEVRGRWEERLGRYGAQALHAELGRRDPQAAAHILPTNGRRIVRALEVGELTGRPFPAVLPAAGPPCVPHLSIGLGWERPDLDARIERRVHAMIAAGLEQEVRVLLDAGLRRARTARRALGYEQMIGFIDGPATLEEATEATVASTRTFARRQERWFRRDPRTIWLDGSVSPSSTASKVEGLLAQAASSLAP